MLNKIFYAGFTISFIGSLSPGLLNIVALQVSDVHGAGTAMLYAAGATIAEMLVIKASLSGMNWFITRKNLFAVLEWMTACILILFASACFIAAYLMKDFEDIIPQLFLPPFLFGLLLSLLNPLHIPFWLGWSGFLSGTGTLTNKRENHLAFIIGAGIGTAGGFLIYITGGPYLSEIIRHNNYIINCIFGLLLFVSAILHIRRMINTPLHVRYSELKQKRT